MQKLDFGDAPCTQVATAITRAGSFARLNVCPAGYYLQMYLPTSVPAEIAKRLFVNGLLPNSRWLVYDQ